MQNLPETKTSTQVDVPEHHVLLAFQDEAHVDAFLNWWSARGKDAFSDWGE